MTLLLLPPLLIQPAQPTQLAQPTQPVQHTQPTLPTKPHENKRKPRVSDLSMPNAKALESLRLHSSASQELGDDEFLITPVNKRTGRPIRKSAGKRTLSPHYVHPDEILADDEDADSRMPVFEEPEFDPEELPKTKRVKKRKRTPSPPPPRLTPEPEVYIGSPASSRLSSPGAESSSASFNSPQTPNSGVINLVAHIAPGFSGPLHIKIDLADFMANSKKQKTGPTMIRQDTDGLIPYSRSTHVRKTGFLSLPAELRNDIYKMVFVSKEPIDFNKCDNIRRSAALLRTCKQVYKEARTFLYCRNTFFFDRNKAARYQLWSSGQKEFGYRQLHSWLHCMSPSTRALIRNLRIDFDDALPSQTPELKTNEERRYVHDGHLIEALKLLIKDGKLQTLALSFGGRRALQKTDSRFMKYICRVKSDRVDIKPRPGVYYYGQWHRISYDAEHIIRKECQRREKIHLD